MEDLKDDSVDLIVTSPPYFDLKDYDNPSQIGHGANLDQYLSRMKMVFAECERVLKSGRWMFINIGDCYVSSTKEYPYHVISTSDKLSEMLSSMNFYNLGRIIWNKFRFATPSGGCSFMGTIFYPQNPIIKYDYEPILLFKKKGKDNAGRSSLKKALSKIAMDEMNVWGMGTWNVPSVGRQEGHPAMFPLKIPYRAIRLFSYHGDIVLDPFMGSGTTALACRALGRKYVGYEINKNYIRLAKAKIKQSASINKLDYHHLLMNIRSWKVPMEDAPRSEGVMVNGYFIFWCKKISKKAIAKYIDKFDKVVCVTSDKRIRKELKGEDWWIFRQTYLAPLKQLITRDN
jgi:site-specific DNA-methyltransferase (adenine-specific)